MKWPDEKEYALKLHGKNMIAGKLSEKGKENYRAFDPATGAYMEPQFAAATDEEVDLAMKMAREAGELFCSIDCRKKADFLTRAADEIMALGHPLIQRCAAETGLPEARLVSERGRTCNQLRMFAELVRDGSWVDARIDTAQPQREPRPKPDVRRMLVPIGPVVVFGASNFPLAFSVAGGDTASALAAGNPVIVKAHRSHPGTSELAAAAIQRALEALSLPPGIFSLLHGTGGVVGQALVSHPYARAVGFTGSQRGGKALFDTACRRDDPIPVYAEMGSVNPVFVLPGALKSRGAEIAEGLKASVTLGVGQFCTNPGLVVGLVSAELHDFLDQLGVLFSQAPAETMLNSGIREAYEEGVNGLQAFPGVVVTATGGEALAAANQARPVVFSASSEVFQGSRDLSREVFGPSTLVVCSESHQERLRIAQDLEGHLTATIHGTADELAAHSDLIDALEQKVGRLIFNGFPTGVEVCPSMNHGGPYPAATDVHFTSVGTASIFRWARPLCYQGFPDSALPPELQNSNPLAIWRTVNGALTKSPV
jgi:NADP-dependent aldehyde dehydrogenase